MANFKRVLPLLNRVLIQKVEAPKQTSGGIYLPETAEQDIQVGKVLSTGPGERLSTGEIRKMLVKEGDDVLLPTYGGQPVWMNDEKFYIYRDTDFLGILS